MNRKLIAFFVGLIFLTITLFSLSGSISTYQSFDTIGDNGHIVGTLDETVSPPTYNREKNTLIFNMKDELGNVRPVEYYGPMPDNFREAEQLIIQARIEEDRVIADHILVKCPSKYQAEPNE